MGFMELQIYCMLTELFDSIISSLGYNKVYIYSSISLMYDNTTAQFNKVFKHII